MLNSGKWSTCKPFFINPNVAPKPIKIAKELESATASRGLTLW